MFFSSVVVVFSLCWGMVGWVFVDWCIVEVWVCEDQVCQFLVDVCVIGCVVVVFIEFFMNVVVQFKGGGVSVCVVSCEDEVFLCYYVGNMVCELGWFNILEFFVCIFFEQFWMLLVVVCFEVVEVFVQMLGLCVGQLLYVVMWGFGYVV